MKHAATAARIDEYVDKYALKEAVARSQVV